MINAGLSGICNKREQSPTDAVAITHSSRPSTGTLFLIESILRATGGFSPCFLFSGKLVSSEEAAPEPIDLFKDGGNGEFASATASQQLTLYISYEERSPKSKRQTQHLNAPYRAILRTSKVDTLLWCRRELPVSLLVDRQLSLACWGDLSLAFPNYLDLSKFLNNLRNVDIKPCCFAGVTSRPVSPRKRMWSSFQPVTPGDVSESNKSSNTSECVSDNECCESLLHTPRKRLRFI